MMLLMANSMHISQHVNAVLDTHLVDPGLLTVDKMVEQTNNSVFRFYRGTCTELHSWAQHIRGQTIMMAHEQATMSNISTMQAVYETLIPRDGSYSVHLMLVEALAKFCLVLEFQAC